MYRTEIRSELPAFVEAQNKQIVSSPKVMETLMKRSGSRLKSRILKVLKVEPRDAPPGITAYMTPRQRRKVHALRRERGGGVYQRTHELINAWDVKVRLSADGGSIDAVNTSPTSEFVYGVRRQRFIEVIGWLDPVQTLVPFEQEAAEIVEANWHTASDPDAGVSRAARNV
jgi:hypothetical protein